MPINNSSTPAGWYPNPGGGQRYWDGSTWLDLPDPDSNGKPKRKIRKKPIVVAIIIVVLAVVGGAVAWKVDHDAQVAAAEEAAEREAARVAEEKATQEAADAAERLSRSASVTSIESSVEEMAVEHVNDGMYDGPILSVTCSPVNGGSTDNLSETTTVFECFVGTEDLGDGRMRGRTYHATMNWTSGEYTYGFGAP
ncbi:DUF2510 domain-containing protein [Rhodococcus sp. HNM0563]|uniref:DUF2510 domain-containing protein n=1 Tax=Rhodococcus sp. HNM0563 TaxID=2716339 RepID=UPI00146DC4EB|nr:DUF2510 domain-containing protein [Rhodococcus sp. HNM0563]NLU65470.1 DUF2510 domain-containing protein [Rhodococcus sp. HNM0563]